MSNEFEKFLFGTFLNNKGVAKYKDEKGRITLQIENIYRGVFQGLPVFFENNDEYEQWIDNIVDDETAIYNKALALDRVISAMLD